VEISTTINLKELDGQERTGVLRLRRETGGARGRENFSTPTGLCRLTLAAPRL
jgi:hypothetical protein